MAGDCDPQETADQSRDVFRVEVEVRAASSEGRHAPTATKRKALCVGPCSDAGGTLGARLARSRFAGIVAQVATQTSAE